MNVNTNNRSAFRKTYPFNRVSVLNQELSGTVVVDSSRYQRHYDFYFISKDIHNTGIPEIVYGSYEEGLLNFNHDTSSSVLFTTSFGDTPIITLSVNPTASLENIVPFVVTASNTGFTAGVSAEFFGTITYRAVYSTSFPVHILSGTTTLFCTAITSSVDLSSSDFVLVFETTGLSLSTSFITTQDTPLNNQANIYISTGSTGLGYISGSLSAPVISQLNFIGFL